MTPKLVTMIQNATRADVPESVVAAYQKAGWKKAEDVRTTGAESPSPATGPAKSKKS